jgi:hypothetical protein
VLAFAVAALTGACSLFSSLDELEGTPSEDGGVDAPEDASSGGTGGDSGADAEAGGCDAALSCDPGEVCSAGACVPCSSATTDCDQDGWLVSEGDCCDKPGACGSAPELVNPGAIELVGNGIDDNCNDKLDLFDAEDALSCDSSLYSSSLVAENYARAMGICRTTTADPVQKQDLTWGLVSAELLLADGSPLSDVDARSIRTSFGQLNPATIEGDSVAVLSTGIASDATQLDPGPNGGAPGGSGVSNMHDPPSQVDISACTLPGCIADWFAAENLPLKPASELPTAPGCPPPAFGDPKLAHDSVMLRLVLRAPTNAKAFSFNVYFISSEYPEFVCSSFNDQFVALIDTPNGAPSAPNPSDKNLLTYASAGEKWPVGINVAHGTNLFSVCESETANPPCWDTDVASQSCQLGPAQLAGTGFEKPTGGSCLIGGGTGWLTTAGNVVPGANVEVRIVIWDVGDSAYDSLALIDGFEWKQDSVNAGTM